MRGSPRTKKEERERLPRLSVFLHDGSDLTNQLGGRGILAISELVLLGRLPGLVDQHPRVRAHPAVNETVVLADGGHLSKAFFDEMVEIPLLKSHWCITVDFATKKN